MLRTWGVIAACLLNAEAFAAPNRFELIGTVSGAGRHEVQVTLFAVNEPFASTTFTDFLGEFRFHGLRAGDYTLSVLKASLGAVRRTVVISPSLADAKDAIRVAISYDAAEASGVRGGTISASVLSVPARAKAKAEEAHKRLGKRDVDGAKACLQEAISIAPHFAQAWNALGMIAYQTHDLIAAEQDFRTAIAAEPSAFEPLVNLAGVLLSENRYEESLKFDEQALTLRPADSLANVQAGIGYFAVGKYDLAEAALTETLRTDPAHFSKPQLFLADIYLLRGDIPGAVRQLKDYLDRRPDSPERDRLMARIQRLEAALTPQGAPAEAGTTPAAATPPVRVP